MEIIYKSLKDLKPYKNNAKKHSGKQIEMLTNSIKQFGFKSVVLIDRNNTVVAGHGRCLAAKKAGLKEIPCVYIDDLTEEQIKAFRLADNKTAESEWDYDLLDAEINDLLESEIDMSEFGFDIELSDEELEEQIQKEVNFKINEKHLVIVTCTSAAETIKLQKEFEHRGYKCDVKNT